MGVQSQAPLFVKKPFNRMPMATIGSDIRGNEIGTEAPTLEVQFYSGGAAQDCAKVNGVSEMFWVGCS